MTPIHKQSSQLKAPQRHIVAKGLKSLAKPLLREYSAVHFPFCMTEEAQDAILSTVGQKRPETGGMLFGPIDRMGVSLFEFDVKGSQAASGSVYKPDNVGGQKRRNFHLSSGAPLIWWGQLHSHPGQFNRPSGKSGRGEGDMGYVEEVFIQNESMQHFFMPILNLDADGSVFISPYIITRDHPDRIQVAPEVIICDESEFPESEFPVPFRLKDIEDKVKGLSKLTGRDSISQREIRELREVVRTLSDDVTKLGQQTARADKSLRQDIERRQNAAQQISKQLYTNATQRIEQVDLTGTAEREKIQKDMKRLNAAQKKSVEKKIEDHSRTLNQRMAGLAVLSALALCTGGTALYVNYTHQAKNDAVINEVLSKEVEPSLGANAGQYELLNPRYFGPL